MLDAAKGVLSGRRQAFEVLSDPPYNNIGLEGWLQTELIVSLRNQGYDVVMKDKVARDCDMIVKISDEGTELGIELKASTTADYSYLRKAFKGHPRADLYLFLVKHDKVKFENFITTLEIEGYIEAHHVIDGWVVMIVKRQA